MKAFLLAAGLGTRLRPITDDIPKCLVPIGPKPLLQIWLELFARCGIKEVMINTHYLPARVQEFAARWSGTPKLHLAHEEALLGSAGTLETNWDFIAGEKNFLVCCADNLTDIDLASFINFHESHRGLATMALFRSERPWECGIVEIGEGARVLSFEEKPAAPKSRLANAGVYVMKTEIRSRLPRKRPSDISFDLLPRCLGEMYGWLWEGLLIDIGNPQAYARGQEAWAHKQELSRRSDDGLSQSSIHQHFGLLKSSMNKKSCSTEARNQTAVDELRIVAPTGE